MSKMRANRKLFLLLIPIGLLFILGCQREPTNVIQEIVATKGVEGIGDWSCQGDLWLDENNNLLADCSKIKGLILPSMFCDEDVTIKTDGFIDVYGGYCKECNIGDCPLGYNCGSFDSELPYLCIKFEDGNGEEEVTCVDFDDIEPISSPSLDSYFDDSYTKETNGGTSRNNDYCVDDFTVVEYFCPSLNDFSDLKIKDCRDFGSDYICDFGKCSEEVTPPEDICSEEIFYNPPNSYTQKGSVSTLEFTKTDTCISGTELKDYHCSNGDGKQGNIVSDEFDCSTIISAVNNLPLICRDGKCTKSIECTIDPECPEPACVGMTAKCVSGVCKTEGECVDCTKDSDCDDNNEKTEDKCVENKCQNIEKPFDFTLFLWFGIPIAILLIISIIFYFQFNKSKRRKR